MTGDFKKTGASLLGRRIAATLVATALSAIGGALSWELLLYGGALALTLAMGLVAVATVIGTLGLGRMGLVVGPLLGATPLSVIFWVQVINEGDPQGPIAAIIVTFMALCVSAASWGFTFAVIRRRNRRRD